jgi:hypothetical protein
MMWLYLTGLAMLVERNEQKSARKRLRVAVLKKSRSKALLLPSPEWTVSAGLVALETQADGTVWFSRCKTYLRVLLS